MSNEKHQDKLTDLLFNYETHPQDLPLLKQLGLRTFRDKNWQEIYIGHTYYHEALIFIWVTGAPAQFWRFAIADFNNYQLINVTTGSGPLTEHWPHVQRIADGMIGADCYTYKTLEPFN